MTTLAPARRVGPGTAVRVVHLHRLAVGTGGHPPARRSHHLLAISLALAAGLAIAFVSILISASLAATPRGSTGPIPSPRPLTSLG